jgi:catechol 2,3-dioxygenase-like lactoylglutathione lyase family enzyme
MRRPIFVITLLLATTAGAAPVTDRAWQEAVVSVTDLDASARFFIEIGSYETKWRGALHATEIAAWGLPPRASGHALLLGPRGEDSGLVRLVRFDDAGVREPTRPGARPWDTGCYFSLMVRMKDMQAIYADAIAMGWWTETPITYLEFGESKLYVMVFRGPDGVQVQGYERLAPPLPEAIPAFERLTRPFNAMQMVRDADAAYAFFTAVLGFDTFFRGEPYFAPEPEYMPLGVPKNLTTTVPYIARIVYPTPSEFGRMEMIEIRGLDGRDHADRCHAPNLGILAVRFEVADADEAMRTIATRDWPIDVPPTDLRIEPYGALRLFSVKTPDGANVQFYAD